MTKSRLEQLLAYYKASKNVLKKSYETLPEKFNKQATDTALELFEDTISVLEYVNNNLEFLENINQVDVQNESTQNFGIDIN
jgi:hypothetical protein